MADDTIEIDVKTNVDEKGLNSGLEKITKKIEKFGNSSKLKGLANIGASLSGVGTAFKIVSDSVKAVKGTIDELSQAYTKQASAEVALTQAAKNNPYLLSTSVTNLKQYASQLQSISTYGDEELLPLMAQLASSGRTEEEIMKIMSASVDVAASGAMGLESAVKNLNKTYGGLSGELGETIPQIKALTTEELKEGKAVEILASQYAGMAGEVSKTTGTKQQLSNAIGDLKEEMGEPFEKAMSPIRAFFTELVSGWASAKKARREYEEATQANQTEETRTADTLQTEINGILKEIEEYNKQLEDFNNSVDAGMRVMIEGKIDDLNILLKEREKQLEEAVKKEKQAAEKQKKIEKQAEAKAQLEEEMQARDKLRAAYDETLRQKQEEIKQRRINGEEISEEAEAMEMYNTAFAAYIKMMSDPAFKGNSGTYEHEVNAREDIADWAEIMNKGKAKEAVNDFVTDWEDVASEISENAKSQYDTLLEQLDEQYQAVISMKNLEKDEKLRIDEEYAQAKEKIENARQKADKEALLESIAEKNTAEENYWTIYKNKSNELKELDKEVNESTTLDAKEKEEQKTKIIEAEIQARKEVINSIASDIQNYTSQTVSMMSEACDLMLETIENEATAEQATLELKYRKGEISEEEYNEAITKSKQEAAKEQYKIQMIQWSASVLQATANIAQGVTQAIAQGGAAGLITGSLVAAAGGVQLASIIASKPIPPSFATGGFIGGMNGASMGADNTYIHARTGELVANAAQQRNLWEAMNGKTGTYSGANIVINNSAANIVSAQPQLSRDKIEILIDARVNDSLKNGRYNSSLNMAQQGMSGNYYGI
jgi:hypothetical protein